MDPDRGGIGDQTEIGAGNAAAAADAAFAAALVRSDQRRVVTVKDETERRWVREGEFINGVMKRAGTMSSARECQREADHQQAPLHVNSCSTSRKSRGSVRVASAAFGLGKEATSGERWLDASVGRRSALGGRFPERLRRYCFVVSMANFAGNCLMMPFDRASAITRMWS
jgi:hypothetical protein